MYPSTVPIADTLYRRHNTSYVVTVWTITPTFFVCPQRSGKYSCRVCRQANIRTSSKATGINDRGFEQMRVVGSRKKGGGSILPAKRSLCPKLQQQPVFRLAVSALITKGFQGSTVGWRAQLTEPVHFFNESRLLVLFLPANGVSGIRRSNQPAAWCSGNNNGDSFICRLGRSAKFCGAGADSSRSPRQLLRTGAWGCTELPHLTDFQSLGCRW